MILRLGGLQHVFLTTDAYKCIFTNVSGNTFDWILEFRIDLVAPKALQNSVPMLFDFRLTLLCIFIEHSSKPQSLKIPVSLPEVGFEAAGAMEPHLGRTKATLFSWIQFQSFRYCASHRQLRPRNVLT